MHLYRGETMLDYRMNTFLTLCRVMNYRKAAEELNMTQPAVTQHIHYLEEQYGCKLFVYDKKMLFMTKEAEQLMRYAQNVTYQERALRTGLLTTNRRPMRIGTTKTIAEYAFALPLHNLIAQGTYQVSVTVDNTRTLLKRLEEGDLDFLLVEGSFERKNYGSRLYHREAFVGICSKTHRFANRTVSLGDCLKETILLREEGSGTRDILERSLFQQNYTLNDFEHTACIDHVGLIVKLLENNSGVTFGYESIAKENPKLATFRLEASDEYHDFRVVYLENEYALECVEEFLALRYI